MPTPTRRTIRRTPTGGAGPRAAGDSVTIDLSHARTVLRIDRSRQHKKPDAPPVKTETVWLIASQAPSERPEEARAKLARDH